LKFGDLARYFSGEDDQDLRNGQLALIIEHIPGVPPVAGPFYKILMNGVVDWAHEDDLYKIDKDPAEKSNK
jgi:hypothetical protein